MVSSRPPEPANINYIKFHIASLVVSPQTWVLLPQLRERGQEDSKAGMQEGKLLCLAGAKIWNSPSLPSPEPLPRLESWPLRSPMTPLRTPNCPPKSLCLFQWRCVCVRQKLSKISFVSKCLYFALWFKWQFGKTGNYRFTVTCPQHSEDALPCSFGMCCCWWGLYCQLNYWTFVDKLIFPLWWPLKFPVYFDTLHFDCKQGV